ncbi:MAG TPA: TetR/AcrR family transcriptional regulator [Methyloceanibacter sp.]|nr:TetR/AcrR family transcriptional regulator [Methyloceanibacter sp.]
MASSSPRERLIEAGLKLFYRDGFHATGIEAILAEAGVAKKTLYSHFRSKEDLIVAVMRRRDENYRAWFTSEVQRRGKTPLERLLACFDVIEDWARSKDFYGCACINASAEFADPRDPVHKVAAGNKAFVASYLRHLARDAGLRNPERLSRQLLVLIDGAVVVAQVTGEIQAVADAKRAAGLLVAEAKPDASARGRTARPKAALPV